MGDEFKGFDVRHHVVVTPKEEEGSQVGAFIGALAFWVFLMALAQGC